MFVFLKRTYLFSYSIVRIRFRDLFIILFGECSKEFLKFDMHWNVLSTSIFQSYVRLFVRDIIIAGSFAYKSIFNSTWEFQDICSSFVSRCSLINTMRHLLSLVSIVRLLSLNTTLQVLSANDRLWQWVKTISINFITSFIYTLRKSYSL